MWLDNWSGREAAVNVASFIYGQTDAARQVSLTPTGGGFGRDETYRHRQMGNAISLHSKTVTKVIPHGKGGEPVAVEAKPGRGFFRKVENGNLVSSESRTGTLRRYDGRDSTSLRCTGRCPNLSFELEP